MKAMKTKDMTLIAVMAALICVAGPLSIPVGPIPLSLATFAVYLAGPFCIFGPFGLTRQRSRPATRQRGAWRVVR